MGFLRVLGVLLLTLFVVSSLTGCYGRKAREKQAQEALTIKWQAEHPGEEMPDEVKSEIKKFAEEYVAGQISEEAGEMIDKAGGVITAALSGNLPLAGMGLIGLFGLAFGSYRRGKEAKEVV